MSRLTVALLSAALLTACATIPDVRYSYYPAKSETVARVTQTLGCTGDKPPLLIMNTATAETMYSSDLSRPPLHVDIKSLQGWVGPFADSHLKMTFTEDGRMLSIDQGTKGQGPAIIQAAVTLAVSAMALSAAQLPAEPAIATACTQIGKWGGNKPITLIYEHKFASTKLPPIGSGKYPVVAKLEPTPASVATHDELAKLGVLPDLDVTMARPTLLEGRPSFESAPQERSCKRRRSFNGAYPRGECPSGKAKSPQKASSSTHSFGYAVHLKLQKVADAKLAFSAAGGAGKAGPIGTAHILVPIPCINPDSSDCTYDLPIPKAELFGTQSFSLSVAQSGEITSIEYGMNSGTAGALTAANSIITPETPASEASALKAQSDLIAQQTRYVLCETQRDQCK